MVTSSPLAAQRYQLPQQDYFLGFGDYYLADYQSAEKFFSRGANTAYQFGNRRFLDSICYWTMLGECYYHMGNYAQAVTMYEQSLGLYLSYQAEDWQGRLQMPPSIQANDTAVARSKVNWGTSTRSFRIARLPSTYQMLFGRLDSERALQQGGVVQNPEIKQVDINEIMRCMALCLHRRRVIKGPTAKFDPLSSQLVQGLASVPTGDGSIMGAYNGVLLGIAYATMEEWDQATNILKSSLQISGRLDHSLTPVALLELAGIGLATGNDAVAQQLALEASYSAGIFNQYDLVEESLVLATTVQLKEVRAAYAPLPNVIAWAASNRARLLQASMIVRLAECLSEAGDAASSMKVLREASRAISSRNSLGNAVVSARLKYVTAVNQFLAADFGGGMSTLASALKHFQTGSLWQYRLLLADGLAVNGVINERQADQLYSVLLRDPTELDWKLDPLESIAFLATPHVGAMERWFEIVVARRDYKRALGISELVRRHRFFANLPLGGRLLAFRWVLEAPEVALNKTALAQRSDFLNRNVVYKQAAEEARQIQQQLLALPLEPAEGSDEARQQQDLLQRLAAVSDTQEVILASEALRREPAELMFPPDVPVADLQTAIGDDQFALVSMVTTSGYHFFLVNQKTVQYSGFSSLRDVHRTVGNWLRDLGVNEMAMDVETLSGDAWKEAAATLAGQLFPNTTADNWSQVRDVVIIPDGILWYLPFESLLIGTGEDQKFLSEVANVRYAPTLALAFGAQRPVGGQDRTAVVTGRIFSRGEPELVGREYDELVKRVPDVVRFQQIRVPSNYLGSMIDRLLVWSQIDTVKGSPLAMSPMQLESGKIDGSLNSWMALPWKGPTHLILPEYQSAAGARSTGTGQDLFLTSMACLASGSRTMLISRWNTGGKTSLQLSGLYLEQMNQEGIEKALATARQTVRDTDLVYADEPRVRANANDPVVKAAHPFFWSGPMLIAVPDATSNQVAAPVVAGDSEKQKPDGGLLPKPDAGALPQANPDGMKPPEGGIPPLGDPGGQPEPSDAQETGKAKPKANAKGVPKKDSQGDSKANTKANSKGDAKAPPATKPTTGWEPVPRGSAKKPGEAGGAAGEGAPPKPEKAPPGGGGG